MTTKNKADVSANNLVLDQYGFGQLPAFESFVPPDEGLAEGAVINGLEVSLVQLVDDSDAQKIAAKFVSHGDVTGWIPEKPEGDGWYLGMISEGDEGVYALWARPGQHGIVTGKKYAQEFLLGSLIKAVTKHLKTLPKPWSDMKEHEQSRVLGTVHNDIRAAVRDAIDIIASNARLTFTASVDQVVFKDGVKAVLTLAKTPEAHSLADAEGSYVTIVIEERSKLLDEGDALEVDRDQKPLFDSSTEAAETADEVA
jgi:hypothetical protein